MLVLVNYKINKDNSVSIQRYQENGKDIVVYDEKALAIMDSNLDIKEEITLIKIENCQYPIIILKKQADLLIEKSKNEEKSKQEVKANKNIKAVGGQALKDKKE